MTGSLFFKIIAVCLVANAIYATFAHKKEKLNIYWDYTDATITALSPVIALIIYWTLSFFEMKHGNAAFFAIFSFGFISYFGVRFTWKINKGMLNFLSATLAKYTVMVMFYAIFIIIIFGGNNRKKGQWQRTADKEHAALIAATAAAYVGWSAWVSRWNTFSPLEKWFQGEACIPLIDKANVTVNS